MIQAGSPAPDFTLSNQHGEDVTLSNLAGAPVVVYFYPKADTPGCTTQACDIRDQWAEFERAGAKVLGISPDEVDALAKFADKYDLPHTLLADPDRQAISAYGAWGERKMYGKTFDGVIRSTFLVGPDGAVAQAWPKVKPKEHADDVLAAISELVNGADGRDDA
ncbi:MAG: thioredoxin-dependent thiol peroxidase [Nitriliruptoraceae bacterium]